MPRKLDWVHLYDKKFKTESLFKSFFCSKLVASINKNNKTNCSIWESNKNGHRMETLLLRCDGLSWNSAGICSVRHKIAHCFHFTDYQFNKLWSKTGIGTDEDHFQLCFTSKNLLKNFSSGKLFHLDATYRILKTCLSGYSIWDERLKQKYKLISQNWKKWKLDKLFWKTMDK